MSEGFVAASGRKVVSRSSGEQLGGLTHLVVDIKRLRVVAVVVGKGRKARVASWEQLSGFGPDAVMVADESALHEPVDDHERAAAGGKLELVGKRALSDMGTELGEVSDVVFDPDTGLIESLQIGERKEPATSLLGAGSYAAVIRAGAE